jgi:hypothetical protein
MSLHVIFGLLLALWGPPAGSYSGQATIHQKIPKDLMITFERIESGFVHNYILTITADGAFAFKGGGMFEPTTINSSISQKQLKQLMAEFDRAKFFSLEDDYSDGPRSCWADGSSAFISIRIDGKSKKVGRNKVCDAPKPPQKLTKLENEIIEIALRRNGFVGF